MKKNKYEIGQTVYFSNYRHDIIKGRIAGVYYRAGKHEDDTYEYSFGSRDEFKDEEDLFPDLVSLERRLVLLIRFKFQEFKNREEKKLN